MKSIDILTNNHDIHMHSRNFSDGAHDVADVVRYTSRWQREPRWVGFSDHSPGNNNQLFNYVAGINLVAEELIQKDQISILCGLELDYSENGAPSLELDTKRLDYVIAAYHKGNFSDSTQVDQYFLKCAECPACDVVAHPDRFLGPVDSLGIHWERIFDFFSEKHVLCEYNLTTPLRSEIFDIAFKHTDVRFAITSDTHNFHDIATTRIVNAWSESLAGNFDSGFEYLRNLLLINCKANQIEEFSELFVDESELHKLQYRLSISSVDPVTGKKGLTPEEQSLHDTLIRIPECELDQKFLLSRLERFSDMESNRIASLSSLEDFNQSLKLGRIVRKK